MNCCVEQLSDAELVADVARLLSVPRVEPPNSFVLHAPLELIARAGLLRWVDPAGRREARDQIVRLGQQFAATGSGLPAPSGPEDRRPLREVARDLVAALDAGDLDATDRHGWTIGRRATAEQFAGLLGDVVVPHLGAAAHGAIFLHGVPRALANTPGAGLLCRGLLRDLAMDAGQALTWMDHRDATVLPAGDLFERLLPAYGLGSPGNNFIFPTMSFVEGSGLAAEVLDSATRDLPVAAARRHLLRIAAMSMLQDDPAEAPYGWSHALTMPQAMLGIAERTSDAGRAVAVAATYVLGFRAAQGKVDLDPHWCPPVESASSSTFPGDVLAAGPAAAAATVWHAGEHDRRALVRQVATFAAAHEDAHLVKYTLACLDAAAEDRPAARLFHSAAAYLAGWWHERPAA